MIELPQTLEEGSYLARQEATGLTAPPKLFAANRYDVVTERAPNSLRQVAVVMLSHPSIADDEYDSLVGTVRTWFAGLTPKIQDATAREIRLQRNIESGIPASFLSAALPEQLLLTYRRASSLVLVVDPPGTNSRRIFAIKDLD